MNRKKPQLTNNEHDESPGKKSFIVVCYDIADDKRRARLHRELKKFGLGVQYSVFECVLTKARFIQLKKVVTSTIKTKKGDRVRYYFLCESCRRRIDATDGVIDQDPAVIYV